LKIYKRLYIILVMDLQHATLGTLLRALLDQLDPAVEQAYRDLQLDYRPRYTPVLRTLMAQGPCRIKDLASACGLSHSALSQTVAAMVRDGWLHASSGDDGRERILQLSPRAQRAMPALQAQWQATAVAARSLDADLGQPLEQVLRDALAALAQRPFAQRLQDARRR
jgi:DNA-binding MarR family transcriptional regulator